MLRATKRATSILAIATMLGLAPGVVLLTAPAAIAQGVPVNDVTGIGKLVELISEAKLQLKEMIAQNLALDEQTMKMLEQIALLQDQLAALKNGLDLGDLGIDKNFLRDILPPDIRKIMTAVRTGDFSEFASHGAVNSSSVTGLLNDFYSSAGIDPARVKELANSEDASNARIGAGAQAAAGLSVAAQASAEEASAGLERVDALVRKIPETKNVKQAMDLNTRVTAELAISLANIWAMEAAQTISQGQMGVIDAATLAEDERFLDLTGND